jgi:hypothetical protein
MYYITLTYVGYGAMPFVCLILQPDMDVGFIHERGLETLPTMLDANLNGQPMDVPLPNGGDYGKPLYAAASSPIKPLNKYSADP